MFCQKTIDCIKVVQEYMGVRKASQLTGMIISWYDSWGRREDLLIKAAWMEFKM
jgi:hypothetical protein